MIYRTITKSKYTPVIKAFILLLIASLNSCMTYETKYLSPDEFRIAEDTSHVELQQIYTNSDSVITPSDYKTIEYHPNYKNFGDVFLISTIDTILQKNTAAKSYVVKYNGSLLKLKDINKLKVEKSELDVTTTLLLSAGIIAVSIALYVGLSFYLGMKGFGEAFRR
jgi:hypothetical protein